MARIQPTEELENYKQAKQLREPHEQDWRLAAAYVNPRHYSAWTNMLAGPPIIGSKTADTRRLVFDSTGVRALPKYVAILDRICTPQDMRWQLLTASDPVLRKSYRVKAYFEELNNRLFGKRTDADSMFTSAKHETYGQVGTYGMGPLYYGVSSKIPGRNKKTFLYRPCHMVNVFVLRDDENRICAVYYRIWWNRRMFKMKFPDLPMPQCLVAADKETTYKEFFHVVRVRFDHDPEALDARRHPWVGSYVSVDDQIYIGEEHGFRSNPYLTPRAFSEAEDAYGYSPAVQAMSSLGGASAMKKTTIKQGQKAADPVILTHDDGVLNGPVDLRPGAVNPGGLDSQGRKLINTLDVGNFQIARELIEEERADIKDAFFVNLFEILFEGPEMTATQVLQRLGEKVTLVAPMMGKVQEEWLAPGTRREIDMLEELGEMPEMPPELIEARGQYDMVYTSPMAKAIHAEEASGFMRTVEQALAIAQATQDPSPLDNFNFDVAIPEIAEIQAVPQRWMNTMEQVKAQREGRAKQQQQAELLKNSANIAGAAKSVADMQEQ